jgi:choline dehydrogenase-like flavoprotein
MVAVNPDSIEATTLIIPLRPDSIHDGEIVQCLIIGSGPAGAFAACRLASAGWDVVLLEAGFPDTSIVMDTIAKLDVAGSLGHRYRRVFALGGSSRIWGGLTARLEPLDFGDSGTGERWPLDPTEMAGFYDQAADIMGLDEQPFSGTDQPPRDDACAISRKAFVEMKKPFNVADYLRDFIRSYHKGRLRIFTSAIANEIIVDDSGLVTGVRVCDLRQQTCMIRARVVIAALGGIETPRLLLNSNRVQTKGVGNNFDLVGRFLSTHPRSRIGTLKLHRNTPGSVSSFRRGDISAFGMTSDHLHLTGGLNHYASISPRVGRNAVARIKARLSPHHNYDASGSLPLKFPRPKIQFFRLENMLSRRTFFVDGYYDQHPNPDNRITLSEIISPSGGRKVDIRWTLSEEDRTSIAAFAFLLKNGLRACYQGEMTVDVFDQLASNKFVGLHSHHMGTTRMGASPSRGVVDETCRVYSTKNLFIAGPSLFTTYGYANPFLTVAALSLRLAEFLLTQ